MQLIIQFSFVGTLCSVQNSLKCVPNFIMYIMPAVDNTFVVIFRVVNQFNLMVYSVWIVCIFFERVWHQNFNASRSLQNYWPLYGNCLHGFQCIGGFSFIF
jgi:hypothetical protein